MSRRWPTEKALDHLVRLAGERDIHIHWSEKRPQAMESHRMVLAPRPTSGYRYLLGLHELGHIASRLATRFHAEEAKSRPQGIIMTESAAWAWAAEMADPDLVELVPSKEWNAALGCWGSYLEDLALSRCR